eukprot:2159654-Pyramimonas_sp.AAC.1
MYDGSHRLYYGLVRGLFFPWTCVNRFDIKYEVEESVPKMKTKTLRFAITAFLATASISVALTQEAVAYALEELDAASLESVCDPSKTGFKDESHQVRRSA